MSSAVAPNGTHQQMSEFHVEDGTMSDDSMDGSDTELGGGVGGGGAGGGGGGSGRSKGGSGKGRRKINIEFIEDKSRRHITFSKRKAGIMKKAYELSTLTGTQVLLLVASETGHVYTFATPKLQPLITKPEGKNLIQTCLNAPDNAGSTLPSSSIAAAAAAAAAAAVASSGSSSTASNSRYADQSYSEDEKPYPFPPTYNAPYNHAYPTYAPGFYDPNQQ